MDSTDPSASGPPDQVVGLEPQSPPTTPAAATTCSEAMRRQLAEYLQEGYTAEEAAAHARVTLPELETAADVDRALALALMEGEFRVRREKTVGQRADVLRGLAVGMPLGAAARAAGVSLEVVRAWRAEDERFEAALVAVRAMACAYADSPRTRMTPARARVVLQALRDGETVAQAAKLAGVSQSTVYHHKKRDQAFRALLEEAQQIGMRTRARRRGRVTLRDAKYRLVRLGDDARPG